MCGASFLTHFESKLNTYTFWLFLNITLDHFRTIKYIGKQNYLRGKKIILKTTTPHPRMNQGLLNCEMWNIISVPFLKGNITGNLFIMKLMKIQPQSKQKMKIYFWKVTKASTKDVFLVYPCNLKHCWRCCMCLLCHFPRVTKC